MAVRTASLNRSKSSGAWKARKAIPVEIREAYSEAYGPRFEAKFSAPATLNDREAKTQFADWHATIEARFQNLRDMAAGKGSSLSHREAHALAGRWYAWFLAEHEPTADALKPDTWTDHLNDALEAVWKRHFGEFDGATIGPFDWKKHPRARAQVLAILATNSQADRFLSDENELLTPVARERFLEAVEPELFAALALLRRRAGGDFTADPRPNKFPGRNRLAGLTPSQLFDAYVLATKPARNTVIRWKNIFDQLDRYFPGQDAGSITEQDAFAWREDLRKRLSDKSVNEGYVVAAKAVFNWAVNERKLSYNPFASLKASHVKRRAKVRERSFRDAELRLILDATTQPPPPRMQAHHAAARRWVPWLLIYSGARPGEIAQLRKEDVVQVSGQWALKLTPEAGTIKDKEARTVPLHPHLIEQGFVEFVQKAPKGPLFYNPALLRKGDDDPTNPRRHPAEKTRMRLAEWVREIGVTDKDISPMHAFRNTWKNNALHAGIDKVVRDFVQGHAPETVGDAYTQLEGEKGFAILVREMAKYPRIEFAN